jgi:WD40 repeat protein
VKSVNFSPDGKTIVSASTGCNIHLWDVQTARELGSVPCSNPTASRGDSTIDLLPIMHKLRHTSRIRTVTFSPDGRTLASGSDDETIRLWEAQTGRPIESVLKGHAARVTSVKFSPDGTGLVSASADTSVRLWVIGRTETSKVLARHTKVVNSVTWSPNGETIASAGDDQMVCLWDAATSGEVGILPHTATVSTVEFSASDKILASECAGILRLWDIQTRGQIISITCRRENHFCQSLFFSPDNSKIAKRCGNTSYFTT